MGEQQRLLRQGLAANHLDLYQTNAWFRHAVDTFATMLPLLVDGLAANAESQQAANDARVRDLELTKLAPPTIADSQEKRDG